MIIWAEEMGNYYCETNNYTYYIDKKGNISNE